MSDLPEDSIFNALEVVLESINGVYSSAGVELPTRQLLTVGGPGEEPHDCEQVTVSFDQLYSGPPGEQAQVPARCESPRTAVVVVEVVRCLPISKNPRQLLSTAEITDFAMLQMKDAWLLMDAGLKTGEALAFTGALADVTAGPASGGYQAMVMNLIIGIP